MNTLPPGDQVKLIFTDITGKTIIERSAIADMEGLL